MKKVPHGYQEERIQAFLTGPTKAALIADDMGAGKTTTGTEIALRGGFGRILVAGVRDTYSQWAAEFEQQSGGAAKLRRIDSTKAGKQALADFLAGEDGFWFAGIQFLVRQDWDYVDATDNHGNPVYEIDRLTGQPTEKVKRERKHKALYRKMKPLDLFLLDEAHMVLANRKAIGRRTVTSIKTEYKAALSGTPSGNSFEGMWSVTRWLWPELITGVHQDWVDQWCTTETVYIKGGKTAQKVTGERWPGAFVDSLPMYFRYEAEPVPAPKLVHVDISPEQRDQYDSLVRDMMVWVGNQPVIAELTITQRQLLRTATLGEFSLNADGEIDFAIDTKSAKINALAGLLKHYGEQPVIIGCDRKRFVKVVAEQMRRAGLSVEEWTGDTPSKERDRIKEAFMAGTVRYIVCVFKSMSTGLDGMQKTCSKAIAINELEGDPTTMQQWIRRVWRPPYNPDFEWVKIQASNTFDDDTYAKNLLKEVSLQNSLKHAA